MLWHDKAEDLFRVKIADADRTSDFMRSCLNAYMGSPEWENDDIKTVNVAQTVCAEIAKLATMNAELTITGSPRADWLADQIGKYVTDFRQWVEYGCAAGEVILKPNGVGVDLFFPDQYVVVEEYGSEITGIIFLDSYFDASYDRDGRWFTRFEYHRITPTEGYVITNRCFIGKQDGDYSTEVPIEITKWADLDAETHVEGVEKMLFGLFKMPAANNKELKSRRGLPVFSNALEELEGFDIAYSRNDAEIYDSGRTVLIDSDRLMASGTAVRGDRSELARRAHLPRFVKVVEGMDSGDVYHEINPTLNTDMRVCGMNALLSQIGFKCGFSNGYFVFNEKTGMVTATQVESDDRRTIQTVNDVRKQLQKAIGDLIDALNAFADAYDLAPGGTYEVTYHFQDLTLNEDEDRARWYSYVVQGHVPFWYFLTKYEGFTEEEAKELAAEMQAQHNPLGQLFPQME